MMDWIRDFSLSICITIIISIIYSMLVPKGNMEKTVRFTLSVFFLTCLVSPFITNPPQFNLDLDRFASTQNIEDYEVVKSTIEEYKNGTEKIMSIKLGEKLRELEFRVTKIEVEVDLNFETQAIKVNSIKLVGDKTQESRKMELEKVVKSELGVVPEIEYIEKSTKEVN